MMPRSPMITGEVGEPSRIRLRVLSLGAGFRHGAAASDLP